MPIAESFRVVRGGVTRGLLGEELSDMGLTFHSSTGVTDAYEEVWANAGNTVAINYVEDPCSDQRYVRIRENGDYEVLEDFTRRLAVFWPDELLEDVWDELPRAEMVDTLFRIGITFFYYDDYAAAALADKALNHSDTNIRTAALQAIGLRAWPEMHVVVEQVAKGAKSDLQEIAQQILDRWPK
jgi:hypothetical protein